MIWLGPNSAPPFFLFLRARCLPPTSSLPSPTLSSTLLQLRSDILSRPTMSLRLLPRLATRAARPLRPTAVLLRHPSPLAFRPLSLSFPVLDSPKEPLRLGTGSSSTSAGAVQSSEGGMKAKWVPAEGQAGEVPKVDVVPRLSVCPPPSPPPPSPFTRHRSDIIPPSIFTGR